METISSNSWILFFSICVHLSILHDRSHLTFLLKAFVTFHSLWFLIEQINGDFVSLRSGFFDDEEEDIDLRLFKSVDDRAGAAERSFTEETPANVAVRKSFPESWIFEGGLSLGYKLI